MKLEIKDWINKCSAATKTSNEMHQTLGKALDKAESAELPKNLRPATVSDITEGSIIWYPRFDDGGRKWNRVDEVLQPSDDWKGYCAHDGCRYGLDGAFVEVLTNNQ